MTKRLKDFVDSLVSVDELKELGELSEKRYREIASSHTEAFFRIGRDIILNNIFPLLSQEMDLSQFCQLRKVSHEWNYLVVQMEHIVMKKFSWTSITNLLRNTFTCVKFATTSVRILWGSPPPPFSKIKMLHIDNCDNRYGVCRINLDAWTSLESLKIDTNDSVLIGGIEKLTTLTSLECSGYVFSHQKEIQSLVNLTSLKVTDFFIDSRLSELLPNLTYLESDYPGHFSHFTGNGKLETTDFYIDNYFGSEKEVVKTCFDQYLKGAERIDLKGSWIRGVFSGHGIIELCDDVVSCSFRDGILIKKELLEE